jgi:hypothetical protein
VVTLVGTGLHCLCVARVVVSSTIGSRRWGIHTLRLGRAVTVGAAVTGFCATSLNGCSDSIAER